MWERAASVRLGAPEVLVGSRTGCTPAMLPDEHGIGSRDRLS